MAKTDSVRPLSYPRFLSNVFMLLTRATLVVLHYFMFVFSLSLSRLVVLPSAVIDWKDISEITYDVLMGTLNPSYSLTLFQYFVCIIKLQACDMNTGGLADGECYVADC